MADDVMRGFLYLKAVTSRYGVDQAARLLTAADKLVAAGVYPNKRAAVEAIEDHYGVARTTPMSEEGAHHVTVNKTPPIALGPGGGERSTDD